MHSQVCTRRHPDSAVSSSTRPLYLSSMRNQGNASNRAPLPPRPPHGREGDDGRGGPSVRSAPAGHPAPGAADNDVDPGKLFHPGSSEPRRSPSPPPITVFSLRALPHGAEDPEGSGRTDATVQDYVSDAASVAASRTIAEVHAEFFLPVSYSSSGQNARSGEDAPPHGFQADNIEEHVGQVHERVTHGNHDHARRPYSRSTTMDTVSDPGDGTAEQLDLKSMTDCNSFRRPEDLELSTHAQTMHTDLGAADHNDVAPQV